MTERWEPIRGFDGYEVSDLGRVRSLDRDDSIGRPRSGRILRPAPGGSGYLTVRPSTNARPVTRTVHSLVLEAFVGARPDGMEACHLNGNKLDNRAVNLRWDSSSANKLDMVRHGTHRQTRKTHCPQGHELTDSNLDQHRLEKYGQRTCLTCRRAGSRREAVLA